MKYIFLLLFLGMFSCIPAPVYTYRITVITPWKDSTPIVQVFYADSSDTTGISVLYPKSIITVKEIQL